MSVLHGVKSRQVACLPCQAFAADAIRSSLHLVLLCFGTVFCVCHRFELSFGHLGTKERRPGKERDPLVPHYKVAVFGRTQLRGGHEMLRKALDRRTAGASLRDEQGFGCALLRIALNDDCWQLYGTSCRFRVPAGRSDKTALHVAPLGLDLENVTVGLLPSVGANRRLACKQRRRQ